MGGKRNGPDSPEKEAPQGVTFPTDREGRRSTSAVGREVVAGALREVDPVGAGHAAGETNWRSGYLVHFRRLVEAGMPSHDAAVSVAEHGLAAVRDRMVVSTGMGEAPLDTWVKADPGRVLHTAEIVGTDAPETELTLPLHGRRLQGGELSAQLDDWVGRGVMEPSAADAVHLVMAHPEWLRLEGHTVAVLGAGAEMGPLQALLRWGARVAAVDLPNAHVWERVLGWGRTGAGTLLVPVSSPSGDPVEHAGADLVKEVPAVADWLAELPGRLVLGNYVYADGADNLRVSVAVDALTTRLLDQDDDVALSFLATPTDVFVVPGEAVEHSVRCYEGRRRGAKLVGRPLRSLSGGRLLQRAYVPGADPGVNDSLVPQQGPNYALAKRLQRWRATAARDAGVTVSMNVAPPTRTRSVVKNRALAAAYAGAHRFGVEVFEPATANVLMAALLVHDLHTGGGPGHQQPWQDEAYAAVHGGLWRAAYAPRSALGLAALLGYGAARG